MLAWYTDPTVRKLRLVQPIVCWWVRVGVLVRVRVGVGVGVDELLTGYTDPCSCVRGYG